MIADLQKQLEDARALNAQPRPDAAYEELDRLNNRRAELNLSIQDANQVISLKAELIREMVKDLDADKLARDRMQHALVATNAALREVEHSIITREPSDG